MASDSAFRSPVMPVVDLSCPSVAGTVYTLLMDPVDRIDSPDPVVEAYKHDVDRTLFDRNLQMTPTERIEQLQQFVAALAAVDAAGRRHRGSPGDRHTD